MAYAVGDGNHSFATARAVWEDLKAEAGDDSMVMDHPARYALVELVNLHDEGLVFEPIHRVIYDVDPQNLLREIEELLISIDGPLTVVGSVGTN